MGNVVVPRLMIAARAALSVWCSLLGSMVDADDPGPCGCTLLKFTTSLDGWATLDGLPVVEGWKVVDGVIHLTKRGPPGGHIVTNVEVGDFDLAFDWKISPRGNSGIKYRVYKYDGRWVGLEYQMYDDVQGTKANPKHLSGALYDLYEATSNKKLLPAGEWNTGRIAVSGNQIMHWLNGELIVRATVGDSEWEKRLSCSKFKDLHDFGRNRRGRLMLTDYDGETWFRNLRFIHDGH